MVARAMIQRLCSQQGKPWKTLDGKTCYVARLKVSDNIGRHRHRARPEGYDAADAVLTVPAFNACSSSESLELRHARTWSIAPRAVANTASWRAIQWDEWCMLILIRTPVCLFSCLLMQRLQASADAALSRPIIDFSSLAASTLYSRRRASITLVAKPQPEIGGQGRMGKCVALLRKRIAHALKLGRGTRVTRPSSRFSVDIPASSRLSHRFERLWVCISKGVIRATAIYYIRMRGRRLEEG
jgi:hypothetical protein